MTEKYELLQTIKLTHGEVLISVIRRRGRAYLSMAPRKSFIDEKSGEVIFFIPKRSSIEFDSPQELDAFVEALLRSRDRVFTSI